MPQDSQAPPSAASAVPSAVPSADLMTELVGMLAAVLRLKAEKIDAEQTFRSLGLDSLLTVEFVATVNARYGTAVKPDALFDHPTPLEFARHVARERGTPGAAPFERAGSRGAEREPGSVPVQGSGASASLGASGSSGASREAVLDVLREELARILCCDPWDIDTSAAFNVLGVDSILGAEFVATINQIHGLRERAVTLYDHPSLEAMAAYVVSVASVAGAPEPSERADGAGGASAGAVMGIDALLDAVRDDRMSVDEALGLLPPRA
ncbi:acyl carrier protein [Streptomyces sp. GESEQ-35]|uniref:acyl carrier protein n=1 Tax=Streptomyces sp. GESEQ-35 TaxID=2812657 RepID=UPI001B3410A1|nr:acyl carrier protein [Streptomyces sp. GESEQ-35]